MAVILSAKIISAVGLGCILLAFLRYLVDHAHEFKSAANHEARMDRLLARETSMRLARFCPNATVKGFEILAEDWGMSDADEYTFEDYIAELYSEPNHFRNTMDFITTRYFLGYVTHQPTDAEVWKHQERSYGLQHIRDGKLREYNYFLAEQSFTRTSEGHSARSTTYNEKRLRELIGEAKFEKLLRFKARLERPADNARPMPSFAVQPDMEWDAINYHAPIESPRPGRKPDYNPEWEIGNDILEVVPPRQAPVRKAPVPVPAPKEKEDVLELLPLDKVLARPTPQR